MSFLNLKNKVFLVAGVANRKSVAWQAAQVLEEEGAEVIYSVHSEERKRSLENLLKGRKVFICDVEHVEQIKELANQVSHQYDHIDGMLHSIAFANYSKGFCPFHDTLREDYLQATIVSSFSLVEISRAFKPLLNKDASVVAVSISSQVAAENYGYMGPIKASLDSTVRFLAKSFSLDTNIRFNTVQAGPLKTKSSAGIPGYLDNYLFAEQLTFRKRALQTQEVANTIAFLLSARSSGINGQGVIIDAGLGINYFDKAVVSKAVKT